MPRRDQTPPYEILRHNGVSGDHAAFGQSRASPDAASSTRWRMDRHWLPHWLARGPEIELQLSRPLLFVGVGAVCGLVVLAFVIGYTRGAASASADHGPNSAGRATSAAMINPGFATPPSADFQPDRTSGDGDPRQAGLNYMVLATPKKADAKPLVEFLFKHGIETTLVPADDESVQVVAINEGFAAGELDSENRRAYEKWLRRVGRAWNRHRKNRGYDLSTMYFDRYDAP